MEKEMLIQRLMATFLGELEEHVHALNRDLLALEKDAGEGRTELVRSLFRTVHSLKGAARAVNVALVEKTCHGLENILGGARDGLFPVGPELIGLLFEAADALKDAGDRLRTKEDLAGGPLALLLPRLETRSRSPRASGPAPPATAGASTGRPSAVDALVRVPAEKLDALLAGSGELLTARRRAASREEDVALLREAVKEALEEWRRFGKPLRPSGNDARPRALSRREALALERTGENLKKLDRGIELLASRMATDNHLLERAAVSLEDVVRRVRMLPFRDACEGLDRTVRDLAAAGGKDVQLVVEGGEIELDRSILEGLKDPLMHLVRNAVDHGLEPAGERRIQAKPSRGRVTVSAALRGAGVEVVVADDGRGLDIERIREQARRRKMDVPDDVRDLARLVFLPAFSTAPVVTDLSGRGIGLDVVTSRVKSLRGTVDFSFEEGRGTRFVLAVPLTLTTIRALLLECAGQVFALPAASIGRLVCVGPADLGSVEGREVLLGNGTPVPVASLAETLGIASAEPLRPTGKVPLAVVAAGDGQVAFAVDELFAEQELVVKNMGPRLRRVRSFAGAAVLPTGRVALILSAAELVQSALVYL
ncbi:MAG: chemotaxis protein CheA, partial [Candidatus Binatia bacterium]